jgi:class 3 adenylate cyclase
MFFIVLTWVGFKEALLYRGLTAASNIGLIYISSIHGRVVGRLRQEILLIVTCEVYIAILTAFAFKSLIINDFHVYWYGSCVLFGYFVGFFGRIWSVCTVAITASLVLLSHDLTVQDMTNGFLCLLITGLATILSLLFSAALELETKENAAKQARIENLQFSNENLEKVAKLAETISCYTTPRILTEINLGFNPLEMKPRERTIAVCMMDMIGFTEIIETETPLDVVNSVNSYYEVLNECAYQCFGEVDKIMGDGIMIYFHKVEHAELFHAMAREKLRVLMGELQIYQRNLMLRVSAGFTYGTAIEANIGSKRKYDRTFFGKVVNECARLEKMTRSLGANTIVSEDYYEGMKEKEYTRLIGKKRLKGFLKPRLIYELFSHDHESVKEWKLKSKKVVQECVHLIDEGISDQAYRLASELLKICPNHRFVEGKKMDPLIYDLLRFSQERRISYDYDLRQNAEQAS